MRSNNVTHFTGTFSSTSILMQCQNFLNTSATNYYLEELIKNANERLILISPFLKLNERVKELLQDKNRLKIDIRIVYGKSELQPKEISWLRGLEFIRTSFCKNLHVKCYLNEKSCIITSLNLYEFSQVNNNEMGVYILRNDDREIYKDTYDEAQRIIRISEEIRITLEKIITEDIDKKMASEVQDESDTKKSKKITSSKLAKKLHVSTQAFHNACCTKGYLDDKGGKNTLTEKGKAIGGEFKFSKKFGSYFIWPDDLNLK